MYYFISVPFPNYYSKTFCINPCMTTEKTINTNTFVYINSLLYTTITIIKKIYFIHPPPPSTPFPTFLSAWLFAEPSTILNRRHFLCQGSGNRGEHWGAILFRVWGRGMTQSRWKTPWPAGFHPTRPFSIKVACKSRTRARLRFAKI